MKSDYCFVARVGEIPDGGAKRVVVDNCEVALWRVQGRVYAIANLCAHQHLPTIHEGELKGLTVSCPMHGWTFSLETGREVDGRGKLAVYPVKVEGEDVLIDVSSLNAGWGAPRGE